MADMNRFLFKQVKENTEDIEALKFGSVARYVESVKTVTGYSVLLTDASPFADGLLLMLKIPCDSIPDAALNYDNVGDKPLHINDAALKQGTLKANSVCFVRYSKAKDCWDVISGGSLTDVVVNGNGINYSDTSGASTSYIVNIPNAPAPYIGYSLMLRAHVDSNSGQTLNYNGAGNVAITASGIPIDTGTIKAKSVFIVVYVGTSWELISGSGEGLYYYLEDDAMLGKPKYNIVTGITDGQTSFSIIGGEITAYDSSVEVIRFLINGAEQIPALNYTFDEKNLTITMVGKVLSHADTHVVIKYRNVSLIPKGTIIQPTIASSLWVAVGDHFETTISTKNTNEHTSVLFANYDGDDSSTIQTYEYIRCKVKAISIGEGGLVLSAVSKPRTDIRCSILLVRNNSAIPKQMILYPTLTTAEWISIGDHYETSVSTEYVLYGANILFTIHEDFTELQAFEYANCKVKAYDILENKILIRATKQPSIDIKCSILITR